MTQGYRVYLSPAIRAYALRPGEYVSRGGDWWAVLPNLQFVRLTDHAVTEHADGTITVDGAILAGGAFALSRGVWQEAA